MTQVSAKRPELTASAFDFITRMAYDEAGLHLPETKRAFVYSRLQKRLRALRLPDFDSYCRLLEDCSDAGKSERILLISALTTNVTQFFREPHHFEMFAKELLPDLVKRAAKGEKIRIWSAGCSAGMEPFSIALTCLKEAPSLKSADLRILASDIDPAILSQAQRAEYPMSAIPNDWQGSFNGLVDDLGNGNFKFSQAVRDMVAFRRLNLLSEWPFAGAFDAIFCRNVAIYFDAETQRRLFGRLASQLKPHGFLYVGHSERAPVGAKPPLVSCGLTTYRLATE